MCQRYAVITPILRCELLRLRHIEWETADTDRHVQLNDPSLFKQECYVNGEWIKANSGKTFEVTGANPLTLQIDE